LIADERVKFQAWRKEWEGRPCVFLGLDGTQALFAVDLAGETEPVLGNGSFQEMRACALSAGARYRHRRPGQGAAGLAQAPWLLRQLRRAYRSHDGGYRRLCPNVAPSIFPAPIRW
jgi:hypothetical protein